MSDSETFAALSTTGLDRGAAGPGSHPVAEPVATLAAAHLWLICPLHGESLGSRGVPHTGYEGSKSYVKARPRRRHGLGGMDREETFKIAKRR